MSPFSPPPGPSLEDFMFCRLGNSGPHTSAWEYNNYPIPEEYKNNIYLRLGLGMIASCPIIPNLNIVKNFRGHYLLTCMREADARFPGCDLYYCHATRRFYISALLSALPDKLGSQDWKDKVTDIFEGVPGVQEWLNKSEEFWAGLQRPRDWKIETGDFLKNVTEEQDFVGNFKKYFTGNITNPICEEEKEEEDKDDDNNDKVRNSAYRPEILKIVLPCLAVVYILAVCSFFSMEVE
ncbi:uncharacterized protein LOC120924697 isoform X2 [Rana temporaria]|uniref:uncharacterized protein LOC120924697 isoform X2 n=1 Tax=Rana temporaria TaxID=8407 RepID=UPI001AADAB80|nr:uncharacterized protein LOC120924697 isoform X2 [Rana temporaria]